MQIVLVDPSRTVRHIVTDLVRRWNYEVCSFLDGAEALSYIQQNDSVRVLITSFELPTLSGVELCARVRALLDNRRPLYIILMSSNDEFTKCVQALDNGADEFISKPPIAEELRARLAAWLCETDGRPQKSNRICDVADNSVRQHEIVLPIMGAAALAVSLAIFNILKSGFCCDVLCSFNQLS